ncbi:Major facilitator superfamily transporter [Venustampulla echinocandica]|uniref:Major facilitator superfamily transporter n=1 Tax=Venustampulla echinocandica TaxID=2656787 RepID=A0A370TKT4_9HELO|nr:Major facilitator superfamily transporter [Venustampulla echinocandica]RDL36140.1 Major facilitator superfamily transporter [Venustampulla echinocandica]
MTVAGPNKVAALTVDENTPLLVTSEADLKTRPNEEPAPTPRNGHTNGDDEDADRPLPAFQILVLCFARLIEPFAFFGIFPFINKMIWETGGLDEADVGFYSGQIESSFSLTQMFLMISWGRAADRIGRKPVLVFSLAGISIATAIFGLSKSIPQMVIFRCCSGIFAGTVLTIRAMITENSTPRTQARAFSFFAFSGNLGMFLGPLLGGVLSSPAEQYPDVFGRFAFLKEFPYALPTFVNGMIAAVATIICGLFLQETLKKKDKSDGEREVPMSAWEIVKSPGVPIVLYLYGHTMLLGSALTAVSPVFWFTHPELGGYGFSPMQISLFMGSIGISQSIWLLLVFPPLQHAIGTGGVLRLCFYVWPIFFLSSPLCNMFLRKGWYTAFWIVAPVFQIGGSGVAMAFTGVQLALNDITPNYQTLGTLNAIALTLTSGIRTIGPAAFTSLFAVGARTQIFDGYLVWVVLVAIASLGTFLIRYLPEKAEGRQKKIEGVIVVGGVIDEE